MWTVCVDRETEWQKGQHMPNDNKTLHDPLDKVI
jgi:hypothetical protein